MFPSPRTQSLLCLSLLAVSAFAAAPRASAQALSCPEEGRSGIYAFNVGNRYAGASGSLSAGAKFRSTECRRGTLVLAPKMARAYFSTTVNAKLFDRTKEAFKINAQLQAMDENVSSRLLLKVAGRTLVDKTDEKTLSWSARKKIVFFERSYTILLGGFFPVTFSADVAAILDGKFELHGIPGIFRVRMDNRLQAYLSGKGRGEIGGGPAAGGVEVELRILQTTLDNVLTADAGASRVTGSLRVCFEPVRILISAYVRVTHPCLPKFWNTCTDTFRRTLVDRTAAKFCRYLVKP